MKSFTVIAKFKDHVSAETIQERIPAEQARAKELEELGLLGSIKVAMPRRTVFLEAYGEDEASVRQNVGSLPFSEFWDLDFYETTPPAGAATLPL